MAYPAESFTGARDMGEEAVNPLPDVAGLRYVLTRLQCRKKSRSVNRRRTRFASCCSKFRRSQQGDGQEEDPDARERVLGEIKNRENPELYSIFPFRLYAVEKPDLQIGLDTFAARRFKTSGGWQQDAIQAAYLGLANVARDYVVENFTAKTEQHFRRSGVRTSIGRRIKRTAMSQ